MTAYTSLQNRIDVKIVAANKLVKKIAGRHVRRNRIEFVRDEVDPTRGYFIRFKLPHTHEPVTMTYRMKMTEEEWEFYCSHRSLWV